jgi:hypothetical protein
LIKSIDSKKTMPPEIPTGTAGGFLFMGTSASSNGHQATGHQGAAKKGHITQAFCPKSS